MLTGFMAQTAPRRFFGNPQRCVTHVMLQEALELSKKYLVTEVNQDFYTWKR